VKTDQYSQGLLTSKAHGSGACFGSVEDKARCCSNLGIHESVCAHVCMRAYMGFVSSGHVLMCVRV